MRILHLTDLHYEKNMVSTAKQRDILATLVSHLGSKGRIDLVFFTGDLVKYGNKYTDFEEARDFFIRGIVDGAGIRKEDFIFCGGNHDVFRGQEIEAIKTHISEKVQDNDSLDKFVEDSKGEQFLQSCKNTEHFYKFMLDYFKDTSDRVERLFSAHKRLVEGVKIGIVTINTAWRSSSEHDRNNLLFPRLFVQNGLEEIKDCERKIILMHHDISDLSEFNAYDLEDLIYDHFHYMFSGHGHKKKQSLQLTSDEGIFCCSTPAAFTITTGNAKIGYSLVDIDLSAYQVKVENSIYDWQSNLFLDEPVSIIEIPLNAEKKDQNDFRKTLRDNYISELEKANEMFVSAQDTKGTKDFLDLFSAPVIKTIPEIESSYDVTLKNDVPYETILSSNDNYIIFGKNKSGKSSLLKKVQLDLLRDFAQRKKIPFYLDYHDHKVSGLKLNLLSKIARYYRSSQAKVLKILQQSKLVLLIDNYERGLESLSRELESSLNGIPNSSFIATSDLFLSKSYEKPFVDGLRYTKVFIHDITRNEIRTLVNKWPNIPQERRQFVNSRIIDIFNQLNIPYNYWTVSLFLWIFEKTNDFNFNSNVELIQLYIDNLLEREKIALSGGTRLSYENFKSFLGELAHHLVSQYREEVYSISYKQLIDFTEEYRKHNLRFVIGTEEIIEHIISRGIIVKRENERYSFRLNGVFEFFIAHHMLADETFRDSVISDNKLYLSFGNELELYSGFSRRDETFLEKIYNKTRSHLTQIDQKYLALGRFDDILMSKISSVFDISVAIQELGNSEKGPLQPEEQDKMMDHLKPLNRSTSEVVKKEEIEAIIMNSDIFERFIFILSRVFRNTDQVKNEGLILEIFDFILNSYCCLGYYAIDEATESKDQVANNEKSDEDLIVKLLTNFMPIIVQILMSGAIGQSNLERIILDKINEVESRDQREEYILFLLYFLLIDLNVEQNIKYIDTLLDQIRLSILKQGVLIKLYSYLMFECYDNQRLEKFIRDSIQKVVIKIDQRQKKDLSKLHKKLEKAHKEILIERAKEK